MDANIGMEFFIGGICILVSLYSLFVGISFLNNQNLENTKYYKFGKILSKFIQGEKKTHKIEQELGSPGNSVKFAMLFFFFFFVSLLLAIIVVFG
jgi:hypothetical protein